MNIPQGMTPFNINQVYCLTMFLYNLKQISQQWFEKLTNFLLFINFIQSKFDSSLFRKKTNISFITPIVYVDDIRDCIIDINDVKTFINNAF